MHYLVKVELDILCQMTSSAIVDKPEALTVNFLQSLSQLCHHEHATVLNEEDNCVPGLQATT